MSDEPRRRPSQRIDLGFLRGRAPTDPLPLRESALRLTPYRDPHMARAPEQETTTRHALELAVRVGELMLRGGAGTRDVETSVIAVAAAAGLRRLELDITNQSLLVQAPAPNGVPVTMLRVVRSGDKDYARLAALHEFVEDVVRDGVQDVPTAMSRLKAIARAPRPYPRWLVVCGYAGLAGSVASLLGGGLVAIVVAIVAALCIDRVDRFVDRFGLPSFYSAVAGGAISTVIAWSAYLACTKGWVSVSMSTADLACAVASGIVVMLPGRAMVSSVEDAVTGYPVTGAGRLMTVVLAAAGIVAGVALGLSATLRLDNALGLDLTSPTSLRFTTPSAPPLVQAICGALGAASAALTYRCSTRHILPIGALGGVAATVAALLPGAIHLGATTSIAAAAILVGVLARVGALRMGAPPLVFAVPAVSPMLPGLRIFRSMYDGVSGSVVGASSSGGSSAALGTLIGATSIALAISTGVVLGDALAAAVDRPTVRMRRARRR